ncbi:MAG: Ig-like domain-containing protein, partial [Acidimicrobiales bacterium]
MNDVYSGSCWLLEGAKVHAVADWRQLNQEMTLRLKQRNKSAKTNSSVADQPPKAPALTFGVRAGRTTSLPVVAYASDPSGNVLSLAEPPSLPSGQGDLQLATGAQAFDYTASQGGPRTVSFPYTVSDGKGAQASGHVTVRVWPTSVHTAPVEIGAPLHLPLQFGRTLHYDVLPNWISPQGDPLILSKVKAPAGDTVSYAASGMLSLTANGPIGTNTIMVSVANPSGDVTTKPLVIDVGRAGVTLAPVTQADLESAIAGKPAVLHPLSTDWDPNNDPMTIADVQSTGGASVTSNLANGGIGFLAANPGNYYLKYVAIDNPPNGLPASSRPTTIRVVVTAPSGRAVPIAGPVTTYITPGGTSIVNVLAVASDPNGNVLVVESVAVPPGAPIVAMVAHNAEVRLTASGNFLGQATVVYTISDGTTSVTGQITVVPITTTSPDSQPVVEPDIATVQEGDVGVIDPLANDFVPSGAPLSLDPSSVRLVSGNGLLGGTAFADNGVVRYQAPSAIGQAEIIYGAKTTNGAEATATITVNVVSNALATDVPPVPQPLVGRVLAGSEVTIPIPLAGADPDGESVSLVGAVSAPSLGRIVSQTGNSMTYLAFPTSKGTDNFTYALRSRTGKIGEAVVSIGIAPRPAINTGPVTIPEDITIRPGRTVSVPVLANDYDPEGLPLRFAPGIALRVTGGSAQIEGNDVVVRAPPQSGRTMTVLYTASDGQGSTAVGALTVRTDSRFRAPPIAKDVYVAYLKNPKATSVVVNVLASAVDPDGVHSDLRVVGFPL